MRLACSTLFCLLSIALINAASIASVANSEAATIDTVDACNEGSVCDVPISPSATMQHKQDVLMQAISKNNVELVQQLLPITPINASIKSQIEAALENSSNDDQFDFFLLLLNHLKPFWPYMSQLLNKIFENASISGNSLIWGHIWNDPTLRTVLTSTAFDRSISGAAENGHWQLVEELTYDPCHLHLSNPSALKVLELAFENKKALAASQIVDLQPTRHLRSIYDKVSQLAHAASQQQLDSFVADLAFHIELCDTLPIMFFMVAVQENYDILLDCIKSRYEPSYDEHYQVMSRVANIGSMASLVDHQLEQLWAVKEESWEVLLSATVGNRIDLLQLYPAQTLWDFDAERTKIVVEQCIQLADEQDLLESLIYWLQWTRDRNLIFPETMKGVLHKAIINGQLNIVEMVFDRVNPSLSTNQLTDSIAKSKSENLLSIVNWILTKRSSNEESAKILKAAFEVATQQHRWNVAVSFLTRMSPDAQIKSMSSTAIVSDLLSSCQVNHIADIIQLFLSEKSKVEFISSILASEDLQLNSVDQVQKLLKLIPWTEMNPQISIVFSRSVMRTKWLFDLVSCWDLINWPAIENSLALESKLCN